jgi:uncharacterized protein (DUF1015 family)
VLRSRRDLWAALAADPWSPRHLLPHERTMAGPKADRLALMHGAHANMSPIWALYRERPVALADAWARAEQRPPDARFTLGADEHRLWVVDHPATVSAIESGFAESGPLYIADGHHRYETALRFREEAGAEVPGAAAVLAVIGGADDPGLVVLPTHRILNGVPESLSADDLAGRWSRVFHAEPYAAQNGSQAESLLTELRVRGKRGPSLAALGPGTNATTLLELRNLDAARPLLPSDHSSAWQSLDVALLHVLVVDPLVAETSRVREDVLQYTRDPQEAVDAARGRSGAMAFLLNPTRVQQVLDVADAGDRMPEKSTYFYPKPPTGVVMRLLDA